MSEYAGTPVLQACRDPWQSSLGPPGVIHEGELHQGSKHKGCACSHPDINGLDQVTESNRG